MDAIIGIYDGHSCSASVVSRGKLLFAASEERLSRVKNQCGFPYKALTAAQRFCNENNLTVSKVAVAGKFSCAFFRLADHFYRIRKPSSPYHYTARIAQWYQGFFCRFFPIRLIDMFFSKWILRYRLSGMGFSVPLVLVEHHIAHAMTTAQAGDAVLTMDAFGDGKSGISGFFDGKSIHIHRFFSVQNSLALAYGMFTHCFGFKEGEEGKFMGLASYGKSQKHDAQLKDIIQYTDNTPFLNPVLFRDSFRKWLFLHKSVAFAKSVEQRINSCIRALAQSVMKHNKTDCIAVSGGLFLNVSSNSEILTCTRNLRLFPNAGDGGLSFGAARYVWIKDHEHS